MFLIAWQRAKPLVFAIFIAVLFSQLANSQLTHNLELPSFHKQIWKLWINPKPWTFHNNAGTSQDGLPTYDLYEMWLEITETGHYGGKDEDSKRKDDKDVVPDSGGVHCGGQELPWSMAIPLINQQKKWAWRIALGEVVGVSCNTNAKEM